MPRARRRVEWEGIMHHSLIKVAAQSAILTASILGTAVAGLAAGFLETDLVANKSPLTDSNGISHTPAHVDPNLLNPWGLTASSTSPFWVSDNGAGVATLYDAAGVARSLVVSIPAPTIPATPLNNKGTPTGVVFNIAASNGAFPISGVDKNGKALMAAAQFLFATEDGTILGWNSNVFASGDPNTTPLGACLSNRRILLAREARVRFCLAHEQDIPPLEDR